MTVASNRWIEVESGKAYLRQIKDSYIKAEIRTTNECPDCKASHGKIYWMVKILKPFDAVSVGIADNEDKARESALKAFTEMKLFIN